jgi:hypothetical protein
VLHLDLDQFEGAAFFCAARMLPKKTNSHFVLILLENSATFQVASI